MRPFTPLSLFAAILLSASLAFAQPSTKPAADDNGSPEAEAALQSFRDYNDAMMSGDAETMTALQHASTEGEKTLAAAMVAGDVAVGKLKRAADGKFGADAGKAVGEAIRDISNDELKHAAVTVRDDTAFVRFTGGIAEGAQAIKMRKVDGKWKFDMTQPQGAQPQLAQQAAAYDQRTKALDSATESINSGKFESVDEAIAELRRSGIAPG